jgi:serine/threonine-protein kinase
VNEPAQSPAPGTTIAERWELVAPIGAGAMGDVWRARHVALGHEVAIKLMKPVASGNRELVQRFAREARIAAQLRHRHIARVEDFGAGPDGAPWLVMELLRGESLEEMFERQGRLDREAVLTVARHVGAACDVAHAAGIVHRDLKPANCFMVREEDGTAQVKVLDFGVAKAADGLKLTSAGVTLLGTPVYMSPEQTQGPSNIDGRSDLWSLAVMVFELLTGRLPFDADSLPALLVAIGHAPIPSMCAIDPALPAAVDAWAARALDRDRERRFQTGRELADALAAALAAPLTETRPGAPQPNAATPYAFAPTAAAMPAAPYAPPPPSYAPPSYAQPSPPSYAQPAYPQAHATQSWYATQHAAPPAAPMRTRTALLIGLAVVLTTAAVSFAWVLASRSDPAPRRVSPVVAAPAPAPTPVATPTPAPPVAVTPPPAVAAPTPAPTARRRASPRQLPAGAFEPAPQRPMPVFNTPSQRPTTGPTYNPDEP